MNLGIHSYTTTVIVFCGLAFLLYLVSALLRRRWGLSKKDWLAVLITIVTMTTVTGPMEYLALAWRTWVYNPDRTYYKTFLGAEVETFFFIVGVTLVVSIAAIAYANREDKKRLYK